MVRTEVLLGKHLTNNVNRIIKVLNLEQNYSQKKAIFLHPIKIKKFMKKFALLFTAFIAVASMHAQAQTDTTADISKVIQFKELDHDFGKIPYGKPAEYNLDMKNISSDSVTIEDVKVGCGCTTPKWQPGPMRRARILI